MIIGKIRKGAARFTALIICCVLLVTSGIALAGSSDSYYPGPEEKPEDPVVVTTPKPTKKPKPVVTPKPRKPKPKADYTLTIYYQYMDGSTAAQTYVETYAAGTSFNVRSPSINGYITTRKNVSGIMPNRNLSYVVYYYRTEAATEIIEDYDTPLGLGNTVINIGDCYE